MVRFPLRAGVLAPLVLAAMGLALPGGGCEGAGDTGDGRAGEPAVGAAKAAVARAATDTCVPICTGRVCGDDGCGGSCGTCGNPYQQCAAAGTCECVGTLGFGPRVQYGTGYGPWVVATGNLNADALPDLAVADSSSPLRTVSVLLNKGDGTFATKIDYGTGGAPSGLAVGDVSKDGFPDIAVINSSTSKVNVLKNSGTGTFATETSWTTDASPNGVAIGDLNGDGYGDLAIVSALASGLVDVLLNDGTGSFAAKVAYAAGGIPYALAIGDVDKDGAPDIVVANYGSDTLSLLPGRGDGTFEAKIDFNVAASPVNVAVADLNGDGRPDVVTTSLGGQVSVLLNTGSRTFAPWAVYTIGGTDYPNLYGLAVGDVNGDGIPDLLVTYQSPGPNGTPGTASVLLNKGNGTFYHALDVVTSPGPRSVGIADFNGDGMRDFVTANGTPTGSPPVTDNTVSVLKATCTAAPSCPNAPCQAWDPILQACAPVSDTTPCNDGNACTQADTCAAGVCVGANPVTCLPLDQCHAAGTCDTASGACSNPARMDGSQCNDANACTQADTCQAGACVGANPVVCPLPDQCHLAGTCDTVSGTCSNPAKPNDSGCDDGNACTQTDTCQAGACVGSNPTQCLPLDQCHAAGTCDTASGTCSNPAKANDSPCDDGNGCTRTDTCQAGTCVGTNPVACQPLDQCHVAGTCDPQSGSCSNPAQIDGTTCHDGNSCTLADTCQAGACTGGPPPNCDDGNVCTTDSCDPSLGCVHQDNAATCAAARCDNGLFYAASTCAAGLCPVQVVTACDDGNTCTTDSCDAVLGCQHASNAATCRAAACDGLVHSGAAICANGACPSVVAVDDCDDGNPCTDDACTSATGCSRTFNTATCDDGNPRTTADQCVNGVCVGIGCTCIGINECCDGCLPRNEAGTCDDGDACTTGDTCAAGACHATGTLACDDGNPCTDDACDTAAGCVHSNNSRACRAAACDALVLTEPATCADGACPALSKKGCDDGNPCTFDTCDTIGLCGNAPITGPCNDGNACTTGDACVDGACVGADTSATDCDDRNPCTTDSCDPTGGCRHLDNTLPCNDGNACTTGDTCTLGSCVGHDTSATECADQDPCTRDTCDPIAGCGHSTIVGCCTTNAQCAPPGRCLASACRPGQQVCEPATPVPDCCTTAADCDDGIAQTTDSCDVATGRCHTPCASDPDCNDDVACTRDSCDTDTGACSHEPVEGCCATRADCADGTTCIANSCVPIGDTGTEDAGGGDVVESPDPGIDGTEDGGTDVPATDPGPYDPGAIDPGPDDPGTIDPGPGDPGPADIADDGPAFPDRVPDVPSTDLVTDLPDLSGSDIPPDWQAGGVAGGGCASGSANPGALLPVLLLVAGWLGRRLGAGRRRTGCRNGGDAR